MYYENNKRNKDIEFLRSIYSPRKCIEDIRAEFMDKRRRSRAQFYKCLAFITGRTTQIHKKYSNQLRVIPEEAHCYFCEKKDALQIHHINLIHEDDREENRMWLCQVCHIRLHKVLQVQKRLNEQQ